MRSMYTSFLNRVRDTQEHRDKGSGAEYNRARTTDTQTISLPILTRRPALRMRLDPE